MSDSQLDLLESTSAPDFPFTMSQSNKTRPIVRWFKDFAGTSTPAPTPPPKSLAALDEALNDSLPAFPPAARLPPIFVPTRSLTRPPQFLDNLARSTMPTASIYSPPPNSIPKLGSTPTRSSIDSLRSVARPIHTSALQGQPFAPALGWLKSLTDGLKDDVIDGTESTPDEPHPPSPTPKRLLSPRNPVVFCHGLLGFDSVTIGLAIAPLQVTHWRGIKEALEANGTEVLITRVPATSSYIDRAKVLEEKISQAYPGRSVHLIGHSMGGLDCRYLTSHLTDRKFDVLSVTTIATPHRGSSFADHFLTTLGAERLPSFLSWLDLLPNGGGDGKAFECLTVENMKRFNEETVDVEGVRYFSWGAVYDPGFIDTWKWPHSIVQEKEGPNDGLVSVESSKWGTYLGTLEDVNHLDLVGWINTARYKWAEVMGKEIKFRPTTFYMGIADMLAREVEGQHNEVETLVPVPPCQSDEERTQHKMIDSLDSSGASIPSRPASAARPHPEADPNNR